MVMKLLLIFMIAVNNCLSDKEQMTTHDCRNKCYPNSAIYHDDKEKKINMCYCIKPEETE